MRGIVINAKPGSPYFFIKAEDGKEYFGHRNKVTNYAQKIFSTHTVITKIQ